MPMKRAARGAALMAGLLLSLSARAACQFHAVDLPVTMWGSRALVAATINGTEVRFVLDSGAFKSLLTPAAADQLHLPRRLSTRDKAIKGIGGQSQVEVTTVKALTLMNSLYRDVELIVGGNEPGGDAVGLLGQDILGVADIEYDLGHGVARIVTADPDCQTPPPAYAHGSAPVVGIRLERPISPFIDPASSRSPVALASINGLTARVMFDTGASSSMLTARAAALAGLAPGGDGVVAAGAARGIGPKELPTWKATLGHFKVGAEEIENMPVRIANMELGDVDMLLGVDFFLSHRIYVANGQGKIYLTRESDAQAPSVEPPAAEPTDAKGYAQRGSGFASRHDLERALADLARACELEPTNPQYLLLRGQIQLEMKRPFRALADFNEAIRLQPDDATARLMRARLYVMGNDAAAARADLEAADRVAANQSNIRLDMGELYLRVDLVDAAVDQFDKWIASHDKDVTLSRALNDRCWARALTGTHLDQALADCDAAIAARPDAAAFWDSRGLVHLRRGELVKALLDYDASLRLDPKSAWSLYGRGLIRLRNGATELGQADLASAKALNA